MARPTFNHDSGESLADAIPHTPARKRHACFADGCPMPGSIFTHGTDKPGVCAWHYAVSPSDLSRVTRVLLDWQCLSYEINEARRALTGDVASNPEALNAMFQTAWARLKPLVAGWDDVLEPGDIKGTTYRESYADWAKRLERFLGGRVSETLRKKIGAAA